MLGILELPTGGDAQVYSRLRSDNPAAIVLLLGRDADLAAASVTGTAWCNPEGTLPFDRQLWSRLLRDIPGLVSELTCPIHHEELEVSAEMTGEWTVVPQASYGRVEYLEDDVGPGTGYPSIPRFLDWRPRRLKRLQQPQPFTKVSHQAPAALLDTPLNPLPVAKVEAVAVGQASVGAKSQADELKELSGLHLKELAAMLGVSKTAYQAWRSGKGIRAHHQERLLQVLALVREASSRLGGRSPAVRTWLLTPLWPGGSTPLQLAMDRNYRALSGAILGIAGAQPSYRLVNPLGSTHRPPSPAELEDRLDRLRPHTITMEDDEE